MSPRLRHVRPHLGLDALDLADLAVDRKDHAKTARPAGYGLGEGLARPRSAGGGGAQAARISLSATRRASMRSATTGRRGCRASLDLAPSSKVIR